MPRLNDEGGLSGLLESAALGRADQPYLVGQGVTVSYGAAFERALHKASSLKRRFGESPQLITAVFSDPPQLIWSTWGALMAGYSIAPLPLIHDYRRITAMMLRFGSRILLGDIPALRGHTGLREAGEERGWRPRHPSILFQTSGTTGAAKSVCVTTRQFVTAIESLKRADGLVHKHERSAFVVAPLFHSYGMSAVFEYTAARGALTLAKFGMGVGPYAELGVCAAENTVSAIEAPPIFYRQLAALGGRINLPTDVIFGVGGGPMEERTARELRRSFERSSFSLRYGLTETPSVVSQKVIRPGDELDVWSSGRPLDVYQLEVRDQAGSILPDGREGGVAQPERRANHGGEKFTPPWPGFDRSRNTHRPTTSASTS